MKILEDVRLDDDAWKWHRSVAEWLFGRCGRTATVQQIERLMAIVGNMCALYDKDAVGDALTEIYHVDRPAADALNPLTYLRVTRRTLREPHEHPVGRWIRANRRDRPAETTRTDRGPERLTPQQIRINRDGLARCREVFRKRTVEAGLPLPGRHKDRTEAVEPVEAESGDTG